jgi:2-(1,2-epoxy-1,2-dihydrophenyl)acetyl-CoA isomerase
LTRESDRGSDPGRGKRLIVERGRDGVVRVILNRPRRKNALLAPMWAELTTVLQDIEARGDDRAVVLTGADGNFCSGADMKVPPGSGDPPMTFEELMASVRDCILALHHLPVPTIAAVDGDAAGGGCNLALACDLVLATTRARFSQLFVHRGLTVDTGGSWLLPSLIGLSKAKQLILLGDAIDAQAASDLGLVFRVVEPSALEVEATALARRFAQVPRSTLAANKRLLNHAPPGTLAEALDRETSAQLEMVSSAHFMESMQAFARRPRSAADSTAV